LVSYSLIYDARNHETETDIYVGLGHRIIRKRSYCYT